MIVKTTRVFLTVLCFSFITGSFVYAEEWDEEWNINIALDIYSIATNIPLHYGNRYPRLKSDIMKAKQYILNFLEENPEILNKNDNKTFNNDSKILSHHNILLLENFFFNNHRCYTVRWNGSCDTCTGSLNETDYCYQYRPCVVSAFSDKCPG